MTKELGELQLELSCLSSMVFLLGQTVTDEFKTALGTPSNNVYAEAFCSLTNYIDRIVDDMNNI